MKNKHEVKIPEIEILHQKKKCLIVTLKNPEPIRIKYQDDVYEYYAYKYYDFAGRDYIDKFVDEILMPQFERMGLIN